ncbi:hypothetical protein Tco_0003063 [Tanacetum coccineum]
MRMKLDSIDNGCHCYPTVEENGQTNLQKYSETRLKPQQLQDELRCSTSTKIISSRVFPHPDVNALDCTTCLISLLMFRVKHCMSTTGDSLKKEINDMHTIGMTMQQVQVNSKFLNALHHHKWSKFFT